MFDVGKRLKEIRKQNNYTQEMLAAKLDLAPAAISKYETNRVPIPQDHIIKISNLFNVSTDYLLGCTEIFNDTLKKIKGNNISTAASSSIDLAKYAQLDTSKKEFIDRQMNEMIDIFLKEKGNK